MLTTCPYASMLTVTDDEEFYKMYFLHKNRMQPHFTFLLLEFFFVLS